MKNLLFVLFFFLGWHTFLYAEKIDSYKVDITIEQSGELSIVETIGYHFGSLQKHGIFRDIPSQVKVKDITKDIGLYQFSVQMDGGYVDWEESPHHSQKAGKVTRLKIGSASGYVTGSHTYIISYRVKLGGYSRRHKMKKTMRYAGTLSVQAGVSPSTISKPTSFCLPHYKETISHSLPIQEATAPVLPRQLQSGWILPTSG